MQEFPLRASCFVLLGIFYQMREYRNLAIKKTGCVAGFLDSYYNSFDFVKKSETPWDDNKAPKGWDHETYKRRDIVFFEFPGDLLRLPDRHSRLCFDLDIV